jgi:hypothetical protein
VDERVVYFTSLFAFVINQPMYYLEKILLVQFAAPTCVDVCTSSSGSPCNLPS